MVYVQIGTYLVLNINKFQILFCNLEKRIHNTFL